MRAFLRKHNPEFTMLEAYWAYADWEKMANLVEELICVLAEKICGSLTIEHRDSEEKVVTHDQFETALAPGALPRCDAGGCREGLVRSLR